MESVLIDADRLKKIVHYDPETGEFTWLPRTPDMFKSGYRTAEGNCANWNARYAGTKAGAFDHYGRVQISVDDRLYKAHRLAWLYMTGEWPPEGLEVDHRDVNHANNKWDNLRIATRIENSRNRPVRRDNKLGIKNVSFDWERNKYIARVNIGSGVKLMKRFARLDDAIKFVSKLRSEHHKDFARHSGPLWDTPQCNEVVIDPYIARCEAR